RSGHGGILTLQAAIDRHKSFQATAVQNKNLREEQSPSQANLTQAPAPSAPIADVLQEQVDLEFISDKRPLETAIGAPDSNAQTFAILILDLDNFKLVNDSFGHLFGDRLLIETAKRLQSCLLADDALLTPNRCAISRFGGDEFVILIRHISNVDVVSQVAHQILSSFEVPFNLDGIEIYMGTSIGIAISSLDGDSPERYLRNADIALYRAKNSGKATFQFFSPDMYPAALDRLQLGNDLRRALHQNQLELYYQPIVNIHTNQIQSFEALMRWNHPQRGRVSPAEFIPIAEDTGLIVELDWWALTQACNQLKVWQQYDGCQHIEMCVNLSSKQFSQKDFLDRIRTTLSETQLNPQHLKLEITERIYMHSAISTETKLKQLKDFGVQLSIDDFGTGYSSLSYLYRFPIDTLKIDRSFIHSLDRMDDSSAIVESILLLGEKLGLDLVAEGVETMAQADWLKERGCTTIQGYLYSPPRPANQIDRLLAENAIL
ncbi:MAG: bifunctional diguanylate cyclase/phosphodiesterase, partial [Cyanobacteria bacterium P01_E01_bin.34]